MSNRIYAVVVLGGLAVVVMVVVLVFEVGRKDPSPPSLRGEPNSAIPGEILYVDHNACIIRAAASGATRQEVYCTPFSKYPNALYWVDDDTVAIESWGNTSGLLITDVNLETRQVERTQTLPNGPGPFPSGPGVAPDGTTVEASADGELTLVAGGVRTVIADFDLDWGPEPILWSPDSQWVLVRYYPPRSDGETEGWVVSRDGRTTGTLFTDGGMGTAAWRIPGAGTWPELPGGYQR